MATERADLLGQRGRPLAEGVQQRGGVGTGEEDAAGDQRLDRDQLDLQRRHDAEVALATADGPEQLGLVVRADPAQPAVGGDDLDGADVVGREAVLAAQRAHAAAEGVADDADVGRRAAQPGETELGGGLEDPDPLHAGLDAGDAALRVDGHALHPAGGDHAPSRPRCGPGRDRWPGRRRRGRGRWPRRRRRRRRRRRWRRPRWRGCAGPRRSRWRPRRPSRRRRRRRRGRARGCAARRRRPGSRTGPGCRARRRRWWRSAAGGPGGAR